MNFDHVTDCLNKWASLINLKEKPKYFHEWSDHDNVRTINRCTELDPTGLTTFMLLRTCVELRIKNIKVDLFNLINGEGIEFINQWSELWKSLNREEEMGEVKSYINKMRSALAHYEIGDEETIKVLDELTDVAHTRYSALHNFDALKHMQFSHGDPDDCAPKYHKDILCVKNPNDLIEVMPMIPSGISLVMIKAERASFSYFAFAIRNGGTVTFITDNPDVPHPNYSRMTRNDRHMEKRLDDSYFPYGLMNIDFDHSGHPIVRGVEDSQDLIIYGSSVYKVASLEDIGPHCKLWMMMMFDLINQEYFVNNKKVKSLSYSGSSVVLLAGEDSKELSVVNSLSQKIITAEDVEDQKWEYGDRSPNQWLLDRFVDQVPSEVYNTIDDDDQVKLITHDGEKELSLSIVEKSELKCLDPNKIGSEEEILADRKWAARYNQALVINRLAEEEFDNTKDEITKWFQSSINRELLFDFIVDGECNVEKEYEAEGTFDYGIKPNIMTGPEWYKTGNPCIWTREYGSTAIIDGGTDSGNYTCCINGSRARVYVWFSPKTYIGLAGMLGIDTNQLPEVLRHWKRERVYTGNCILDRVDPMNWVCKDPWMNLRFNVKVCFSKSGFNKMFKDRGLKPPVLEPKST